VKCYTINAKSTKNSVTKVFTGTLLWPPEPSNLLDTHTHTNLYLNSSHITTPSKKQVASFLDTLGIV